MILAQDDLVAVRFHKEPACEDVRSRGTMSYPHPSEYVKAKLIRSESTSRRRRKTRYAFSVASRLSYPPDPLTRTLDPRRERQEKYKT